MNKLYLEFEPTAAYLDDAKRELFASRLPEVRAARIRSPRALLRRAERAAAEAAFRRACRSAGEQYGALTVAYTDEGKPYIAGRPDLAVSFSHTAHLAVVALVKNDSGDAAAVGIDLVCAGDAPAHAGEIAARFFSPDELRDMHAMAGGDSLPPMQSEAFLTTWCRMEARVKMTGEGIGTTAPPTEPRVRHAFTFMRAGMTDHFVALAFTDEVETAGAF